MDYIEQARNVISIERDAIDALLARVDQTFTDACETIMSCPGRVVVLGVGKSGLIGSKIAATLSSTGTPAFFVHAGEASHGDLGMITKQDVVIAISYSGTTPELISLLPLIQRLGTPLISITGKPQSPLSKAATYNLNVEVNKEACPLNLAPTASTTATLVMGDAIAISLLVAKGFSTEDFAFSHPGGALGKRLLLKVGDIMHADQAIPKVTADASLQETILIITQKRLGMTTVVDAHGKLLGIYTDGDIRRSFEHGIPIERTSVAEVMTKTPKTIHADELAAKALQMMEQFKITSLVVVDDADCVQGVIHIHQLLESGII